MTPHFRCPMNRRPSFSATLVAIVVLAAGPIVAAPVLPPLPSELAALQPTSLLPTDLASTFTFQDRSGAAQRATFSAAPGEASPVFRAEVLARANSFYDVRVFWKSAAAVAKGDVCLARFAARAPTAQQESGEGAVHFYFQRATLPNEKSVSLTLAPGPEWTVFEVPFTIAHDLASGAATVSLALGHLPQSLEITGLEVHNFGRRVKEASLPRTRFSYRGREPGAAWRERALQRIDEIRTAPLAVRVTDSSGRPLTGARIDARLVQPEFVFGTSVDDALIVAGTPEAERYRRAILELFDTVVIENGLKWATWARGPERQGIARRALDWLDQQPLRVKGHNLVWPAWKFSPRGLKHTPELKDRLPAMIHDRITEIMGVTRGRVYAWDVVNEPVHERDFFGLMPETAMAAWFQLARSADPDAALFINEYGMLNSAASPGMIARFRTLIQTLRRTGAPIDGIGIQGHVGQQPRPPDLLLADLDLIAAEGLPVQITEFDINTTDEALQADYLRDFLIACYSHPAVSGFIMWGFWEGRHWKPDAAMFRRDWSEKPVAAVWREWTLDRWRTHAEATTDATGNSAARGHLGRYRVTVTHDGLSRQQEVTLTRRGAELSVMFPAP